MTRQLVPPYFLERLEAEELTGEFEAAVLFADISGFTALTETLMQHGKEGAEALAQVLTALFSPLVQQVYQQGGFIGSFVGDAFSAVFPLAAAGPPGLENALAAAVRIQEQMQRNANQVTPFGLFNFQIKLGLAVGRLEWGIVPGEKPGPTQAAPQQTGFFRGPALQASIAAEELAQAGELLLSPAAYQALGAVVACQPVGFSSRPSPERGGAGGEVGSAWRVTALAGGSAVLSGSAVPDGSTPRPLEEGGVRAWRGGGKGEIGQARLVPAGLLHSTLAGEFRPVVSLFLNLPPDLKLPALEQIAALVFRQLTHYGGYASSLDFGDKGAVWVFFWGAPTSYENNLERALDFVAAVFAEANMPLRAGITYGTAFAGYVGGAEQETYTCYGIRVNLAARLMSAAAWGQTWLDEETALRCAAFFQVQPEAEIPLKGLAGRQRLYRLGERQALKVVQNAAAPLVGRANELALLRAWLQPALQGRFAGALHILGEAGIGKSRLLDELRQELAGAVTWLVGQSDEILRNPFNPFGYALKQAVAQASLPQPGTLQQQFERYLDELQLKRLRPALAALVDLPWPDPWWDSLDARARYQNSQLAIKTWLLAESRRRPLVLVLEDAHWLDADSLALLPLLARQVEAYPWAILSTQRYDDQGQAALFGLDTPPDSARPAESTLELTALAADDLAALVSGLLGGALAPELEDLVRQKSAANPFFAGQLALYLLENQHLEQKDGPPRRWQLRRAVSELPDSINAILIARIDRLSAQVKETVQTAAVLGQEFELQTLSYMLQAASPVPARREALLAPVREAEHQSIWASVNELRYIFKHALLRDAAYEMQLRARLRLLHLLAAQAMESLQAQNLAPQYAALAYHYGQAQDAAQELHYARLAGDQAAAQYANTEAVQFFSRALELLPAGEMQARWDLLKRRLEIYAITGNRSAQAQDLQQLLALAAQTDRTDWLADYHLLAGDYADMLGDYAAYHQHNQQALDLGLALDDAQRAGRAYQGLGHAAWRLSQLDEARAYLLQGLESARQAADWQQQANCLRGLGIVADMNGDYSTAVTYMQQTLAIFRQLGDRRGESQALNSLGVAVFHLGGQYAAALDYTEQSLRLKEEMGDLRGQEITLSNLAVLAFSQNEFSRALKYYQRCLFISREINDPEGESSSLLGLGTFYAYAGAFEQAITTLTSAREIARQIGDAQGEGESLVTLAETQRRQGQLEQAIQYNQEAIRLLEAAGLRHDAAEAYQQLGVCLLENGETAAASQAFEQAVQLFQAIERPDLAATSRLRLALLQVDLSPASLLELWRDLARQPHSLPLAAALDCVRALEAAGQAAAAAEVLQTACQELLARAAKIDEPELRQSFLQVIAEHRALLGR